eukprot:TRINITY_DN1246_c0_g1_i3.p2 TRINITY_DN1246_c0_g1~~TRINITY_DN1246_c0_g1_i3.p2  ORF type:complete len:237 (-),score=17.35 TRINITY_DN1246_c0_g1_i3:145-855(-)
MSIIIALSCTVTRQGLYCRSHYRTQQTNLISQRKVVVLAKNASGSSDVVLCRRSSFAFGTFLLTGLLQKSSQAGMNKYVKTKPLDPLSTYVPPVLIAQERLEGLKSEFSDPGLTVDPKAVRQMLRSGSFSGLRIDIRAIAQYAEENGRIEDQQELLNGFLKPFESMDSKLLAYSRSGESVGEDVELELNRATAGLNKILSTIPTQILEQAVDVVGYRNSETVTQEEKDLFLKSILQ